MKHQRKLWKGATPSLPSRPAAVESVRGPAKTGALEHKQFSKASSGRPAQQCLCAGQQDAHSPFLLAHPQLTKGSLGLALKEAQALPSFPLSFLPPPEHPTGYRWSPGTSQSPSLSLGAPEATHYWSGLSRGTELLSLDLPRIRRTSVQVDTRLRPQPSSIFPRACFTLPVQNQNLHLLPRC